MRASWALKALSAVHAVAVAVPAVWALFNEQPMCVRTLRNACMYVIYIGRWAHWVEWELTPTQRHPCIQGRDHGGCAAVGR